MSEYEYEDEAKHFEIVYTPFLCMHLSMQQSCYCSILLHCFAFPQPFYRFWAAFQHSECIDFLCIEFLFCFIFSAPLSVFFFLDWYTPYTIYKCVCVCACSYHSCVPPCYFFNSVLVQQFFNAKIIRFTFYVMVLCVPFFFRFFHFQSLLTLFLVRFHIARLRDWGNLKKCP